MSANDADLVLARLIEWGRAQENVRAMILTSTRTNPNAPSDAFSDYDVIVAVEEPEPYMEDENWLGYFGPVLVMWRDPTSPWFGVDTFARITQYENGLKIDFTITRPEAIRQIAAEAVQSGTLSATLDVGYRVLLDKDGLTANLPAPTYQAYIPKPPSERVYNELVEEFFHEATYVAKHLWRDDLLPAKYNLDYAMKGHCLRIMLEWRMETDHGWSLKTGAYGKRLKKFTDPETWAALEKTYVGADEEDNWRAMFDTIDLFRKVAREVGQALGYAYPQEMDDRAVRYLRKVQALPRDTERFGG